MADREAEAEFGSCSTRVPPHHRRDGRNLPDEGHWISRISISCDRSWAIPIDAIKVVALLVRRFISDECADRPAEVGV